MDYFNSLYDSLNSGYYSLWSYLNLEETQTEITRTMRLYKSEKDWTGICQTLVLDKIWLAKLREQFSNLLQIISTEEFGQDNLKIKDLLTILDNIHLIYSSDKYSNLIKYFFSNDLYIKTIKQTDNITTESFLTKVTKYLDENPVKKELKSIVNEIYTAENIEKVSQLAIMFGVSPPILQSYTINYHKLGANN